ncbi:MAG TPA: ABC transporter substrate-binding protein [Acidimicrobiales bacterium]|nr:ABC transporter substrate-binding protein [Acidimicrobiales bacterium]
MRFSGVSRTLAAAAALALIAGACGTAANNSTTTSGAGGTTSATNQASAPGITPTQITLGSTQPLSGPAAPGYSEIAPASNAVFKWVDAHGGIYGRMIKYDYLNDQYNPTLTVSLTRQLVSMPVFADFNPLGTPTQVQVEPYLNQQGVPQLFVASGCNCWNQLPQDKWTFGWQTDYTIEGKILAKYITGKFSGQSVGYIYQDDEFGQDGIAGLNDGIPSADVAAQKSYTIPELSAAAGLGAQVAALQAAHVKVAVLFTIPAATAEVLLAAAVLGYHPQWVVSSVGADITTLTGLLQAFSKGKAGGALLNGVITAGYLPAVTDTANPWVSLFKQIWTAYDSNNKFDGNTEYGLAVGITMVELLQAAGRNPTRASLVNTLESEGAMLNGPGVVPLSYSSSDHYGYQGEYVTQIMNGAYNTLSPAYVGTNTGAVSTFGGTLHSTPPSFTSPSF